VAAIVSMARGLGLSTISEGVETQQQLAQLRKQGCDEIQGYYYSEPLAPAEFAAFVRSHAGAGASIHARAQPVLGSVRV
jgi:EAL domain-containing protein (putative c-di-GMP-specific phosphodiesterase class I)